MSNGNDDNNPIDFFLSLTKKLNEAKGKTKEKSPERKPDFEPNALVIDDYFLDLEGMEETNRMLEQDYKSNPEEFERYVAEAGTVDEFFEGARNAVEAARWVADEDGYRVWGTYWVSDPDQPIYPCRIALKRDLSDEEIRRSAKMLRRVADSLDRLGRKIMQRPDSANLIWHQDGRVTDMPNIEYCGEAEEIK
jgi:hypothetical protein